MKLYITNKSLVESELGQIVSDTAHKIAYSAIKNRKDKNLIPVSLSVNVGYISINYLLHTKINNNFYYTYESGL